MKKIVLTGGGTAGHVTPNIALLPKLRELGYEISFAVRILRFTDIGTDRGAGTPDLIGDNRLAFRFQHPDKVNDRNGKIHGLPG